MALSKLLDKTSHHQESQSKQNDKDKIMSFAKPYVNKIEDDMAQDRASQCTAHGCPNRWAVSEGHLCSAHAWSNTRDWPAITDAEITKAAQRSNRKATPAQPARVVTDAEKRAAVEAFRSLARGGTDPKYWAVKLKERELEGEQLSNIQRRMWREVLHEPV